MSTTVYPYLTPEKLIEAEEEARIKELSWLLESLEEETFQALKNGINECLALLAPVHPGSTLVLSSHRSENIKGHVTRIGSQIVKGTINLRLRTHAPLNLSISPVSSTTTTTTVAKNNDGFYLPSLRTLSTLLEQALDCLNSVLFSFGSQIGQSSSINSTSNIIFSQLRLLYSLIHESLLILKGSDLYLAKCTSHVSSQYGTKAWNEEPLESVIFTPELPSTLALDIKISDCSLLLTIRVLELCTQTPTISSLFLTGIGVQRRLEHDEMDQEFFYRGMSVRVKEKYQVESSADPCLLSCAAKLQALERSTLGAMDALRALTGRRDEELE
ncbi:putative 37s ribosomal protein rsm22 [Erysiphe neolycopersici]|uniref:Putative 37s ribosomal protein rsm22 n=1 Tax=Erysiphe neolycopersici TaxID=212602 RepID=A0A420HMP5_9PEZI|nr:putative 37s ribosomal protein rsm22 [Erysiphe neolycopersici]